MSKLFTVYFSGLKNKDYSELFTELKLILKWTSFNFADTFDQYNASLLNISIYFFKIHLVEI